MNQKTDYSQKASWYKLPEITRDVDTYLGSLVEDEKTGEHEIVDIGADAQINLARSAKTLF